MRRFFRFLDQHQVRVVDLVARTEVDETFNNDTDEELEGIFRFPLPPGAQIENLTLTGQAGGGIGNDLANKIVQEVVRDL